MFQACSTYFGTSVDDSSIDEREAVRLLSEHAYSVCHAATVKTELDDLSTDTMDTQHHNGSLSDNLSDIWIQPGAKYATVETEEPTVCKIEVEETQLESEKVMLNKNMVIQSEGNVVGKFLHKFCCTQCKYKVTVAHNFKYHMYTKHAVSEVDELHPQIYWSCNLCNKTWSNIENPYSQHYSKHHRLRVDLVETQRYPPKVNTFQLHAYPCKYCSFTCDTSSACEDHMLSAHNAIVDSPLKAVKCKNKPARETGSMEFDSCVRIMQGSIADKEVTKILLTRYMCPFCSCGFWEEVSTQKHIQSQHPDQLNKIVSQHNAVLYYCPQCCVLLNDIMELKPHSTQCNQHVHKTKSQLVRKIVYSLLCAKFPELLDKLSSPREQTPEVTELPSDFRVKIRGSEVKLKKYKCKRCSQKFYSKYLLCIHETKSCQFLHKNMK